MSTNDNVIHARTVTPPWQGIHPSRTIPLDPAREGAVFGALGVLIFSLSMVSTRLAAPELGGLFVGLGRGFVAALLAATVLVWTRAPLPERRHWWGLATVAIGSVIGFPVLSALALTRVTASHGMVYTALLPAATAVVAVLRTGERPAPRFWVWGLLGATAVALFAVGEGAGASDVSRADLQLLCGVGLSAVAYVEGGRLSRDLGGVAVLSWSLVFALPALVPALAWVIVHHPPHGSLGAWAGFGYVSVFSMYLGFLAWYRGMALGGIARISQLQTLQPLLGLSWSALLLGEPLSPTLLVTAGIVIVCVAMGRR